MARSKKALMAKAKKIFEHTQVKPLPKWKNAFQAHRQVQKMTDKQFQLYSAVIDHSRGKVVIKKFYPFIDTSLIDHLKNEDKETLDSLARNMGSKHQLSRWHRKVFSKQMSKAGGWGSSIAKGAEYAGKGVVKVGKFLVKHGVRLVKKCWNSVKAVGRQLKKIGGKALKWVTNPANIETLEKIVKLIGDGAQVAKVIMDLGAAGPLPAADLPKVTEEQTKETEDILDAKDYASGDSGDDEKDDEGKTVGEMLND